MMPPGPEAVSHGQIKAGCVTGLYSDAGAPVLMSSTLLVHTQSRMFCVVCVGWSLGPIYSFWACSLLAPALVNHWVLEKSQPPKLKVVWLRHQGALTKEEALQVTPRDQSTCPPSLLQVTRACFGF